MFLTPRWKEQFVLVQTQTFITLIQEGNDWCEEKEVHSDTPARYQACGTVAHNADAPDPTVPAWCDPENSHAAGGTLQGDGLSLARVGLRDPHSEMIITSSSITHVESQAWIAVSTALVKPNTTMSSLGEAAQFSNLFRNSFTFYPERDMNNVCTSNNQQPVGEKGNHQGNLVTKAIAWQTWEHKHEQPVDIGPWERRNDLLHRTKMLKTTMSSVVFLVVSSQITPPSHSPDDSI